MKNNDNGASASADRATAVGPVPVSPLRDGISSADLLALEQAATALLSACRLADAHEELSEHVDGRLLDDLSDALEWRYLVIWTQEQVDALNASQADSRRHPYTCGGDRADEAHRAYAEEHCEDRGQLIATKRGWVCPVCDYRQGWAHGVQAPAGDASNG